MPDDDDAPRHHAGRRLMGWAQLRDDGRVFLVRVAGVAVDCGRVLLHRTPQEDLWSLPGGRLQVGETAEEALRREMEEEIEARVDIGPLLWVVENFFEHTPLDAITHDPGHIAHHEIGLYLAMTLPAALTGVDAFMGTELAGTADEFALEFRWFPQADLGGMGATRGAAGAAGRPSPGRPRFAGEPGVATGPATGSVTPSARARRGR